MERPLPFVVAFMLLFSTVKAQTNYTWNGSVSTAWYTGANWTPNGVPGASDNVTIVTGGNVCVVNLNTSINNLTFTSGTLDLGGNTLTANGTTASFSNGTVQNGSLVVTGASTSSIGGSALTFNCNVNITAGTLTTRNTTYQKTTVLTKTGATNDYSSGNNTFNGALTVTNNGSGLLALGNGMRDQYNAAATFNNTGTSYMSIAHSSANNTFAAPVIFNNSPNAAATGSALIYVSSNSTGTIFADNITVTSTFGQGVQFCNNTASASLASCKSISIGSAGFSSGTLLLRQLTQISATAQNLSLTGTGYLSFGPSSSFDGDITASVPSLSFNGAIFNGATNFTKTGPTGDWGSGNNVFNGVCSITNSGSSYLVMGNGNPDIWNNDVTFTDNGSERLLPAWSSVGNQFNGNIYVNTAGSASGIQFNGADTNSTAILAAGKTIYAGTTGLTAGYLYLKQFTQLGSTPITLNATGTASLYLGPKSNFGGPVTLTAPDIWPQGATYNSAAVFTKTGGTNNGNNQRQNIFNSTCTINQQSSTGYFLLGYSSNDQFNDNITLNSTGTSGIYLGNTSNTGTPTLAAGKTILIGSAGFATGFLNLNGFTQLGNAPINLTFTGSASLTIGTGCTFGGDITVTTPAIFLNGGTFNGVTTITKTGTTGDYNLGGNTFNKPSYLTNSGSNFWVLGNSNPDTWNADVTFTTNGSERILPAWNSVGNQFNGNIYVNTSGSATGIQFCGSSTATAIQAAGFTIMAGSVGLNSGYLTLRQFTQQGNTPVNLTLASTATNLVFGPSSSFGGNVTTSSPGLYFNGATFNGTVTSTKFGATNDAGTGGDIFDGIVNLTNTGNGYLLLGNGSPDQFNAAATFNNNGASNIYVAHNSTGNTFNGLTTFNNNPTGSGFIYVSAYGTGTTFNGSIVVNSPSGSGVQFDNNGTTATTTLAANQTITVGSSGFSSGTLLLRQFTQNGSTPQSLTLTGTGAMVFGPSSSFSGDVTTSSPTLQLNGCTFNGASNLTKTGSTGDWSYGGNVFNGISTITSTGTNFIILGNTNPDTWNNDVTFTNSGTERILPAWGSTGNQFNGNIYVNTSGSASGIEFCGGNSTATATLAAGKTIAAGSIGLNAGYLILKQFTQLGNAPINLTLASTATTLQFGPLSSIGGDVTASSPALLFHGCTFSGACNATKTGTTSDYSNGGNIFNGAATMTDAGTGSFVFSNTTADQFNTVSTFNNTGKGNIYVANNGAGNVFGGVATFNNNPTANTTIYVSQAAQGTIFNDNIVVSSLAGGGVQFCTGNTTATATLAAGKTITVGSAGFTTGYLCLRQFTQAGATAQNLTLTGTGILVFGPTSAFGGDVTSSSPSLLFHGCTFSGAVTSVKTGPSQDNSNGNNIFNGITSITNNGSGNLALSNSVADKFNNAATFNNTGSANFYVANNSTGNAFGGLTTFNNSPGGNNYIYVSQYSQGTTFADNIVVNSTSGYGVVFCTGNTTASAALAAGKTISVGSAGFSSGTLLLRQFTQTGPTPQSLTLTGTGNLTFGPSSAFGGDVTTVSPAIYFNGCNFSGIVNSAKNGATNDASIGNNTFNGTFTITNTGTGYFMMGNGNPDLWQSTATFNNQSPSAHMYTAYNCTGTTFNGDVYINNTPGSTGAWFYSNQNGYGTQYNGNIIVNNVGGAGVYFSNGSGNATLASGKAISIGSSGFTTGSLIFRSFTQAGPAVINLTTTGNSYIQYATGSVFNGTITSSSPGLLFNTATFNGTGNFTKTGTNNDQSAGNNTFNGSSTFTNTGTGYLLMSYSGPDAYNNNVTFVKSGTGSVYPNYNYNCNYTGSITVNTPSASPITFGAGSGSATLSGSSNQTVNVTSGSPSPIFTRLIIANTSGDVTLNTPISVQTSMSLSSGLLNTTTTNILTMLNGSTTAAGTALSTSYVNGPMRYQKSASGTTTLNFPIGSYPDCRPFVLTVNHTTSALYNYTAQVYDLSAGLLYYTLPPSVTRVSGEHYYTIARTNSAGTSTPATDLSGNQSIQLFFGIDDYVTDGSTLTIVKNTYTAPTTWINIGGSGAPAASGGSFLTGSITSTSSPSAFNSFSTFALANQIDGSNTLPVNLVYFTAQPDNNNKVNLGWETATESNNSYFTVERSKDGSSFEDLQKVNTQAPDGNSSQPLDYTSVDASPYMGTSFYRLRQTDRDGNFKYSNVVTVNLTKKTPISVYPNPSGGTVYVSGLNPSAATVRVEWYDAGGKFLLQEEATVNGGIARLNPRLTNGLYFIKVQGSDGSISMQSILIMK